MPPLFRPETETSGSGRLDGVIVMPAMPSARALAVLAAVATIAAIVFAATVSLPRSETAPGTLTPAGGMVTATAQQGGDLIELRKGEGDRVAAGEIIAVMSLSPRLLRGDSGQVVEDSFRRETAAAGAEAETSRSGLLHEAASLRVRRTSIEQELAETRNQLRIAADQFALAREELARSVEMAGRGYLTRRDLDARRVAALSAEARHSQVLNLVHTLERERSETTARIRAIPIQLAALDAQSAARAAQLSQRSTESAAHNGYVVVAPVSGQIVSAPVTPGNAAAPGQALAVILPEGAPLEAELYLPARAIGRIEPGQIVRLKYQAYPYQTYGAAEGRIVSVSRTATPPGELGFFGVTEPAYKAAVRLSSPRGRFGASNRPLAPDMRLTADIVVDRRTLFQQLFAPLLSPRAMSPR